MSNFSSSLLMFNDNIYSLKQILIGYVTTTNKNFI